MEFNLSLLEEKLKGMTEIFLHKQEHKVDILWGNYCNIEIKSIQFQ